MLHLFPVVQNDYAGVIAAWTDENGFNGMHGFQFSYGQPNVPREQRFTWRGLINKGGHANANSGTASVYRKIGTRDASDGLSNKILFMEKAVNAQFYSFVETSPYTDWWESGLFHNADYSTMRLTTLGAATGGWWAGADPVPLLNDSAARPPTWNQSTGRTREIGFGSAHSGVTNAVSGDGSVRSVNNNADTIVVNNLGRRADGNVTNFDQL